MVITLSHGATCWYSWAKVERGTIGRGNLQMASRHEPKAGSWYVNKTGKLMKVRLLLYEQSCISRIFIEFLDGMRISVDRDAWRYLDLDMIWHDDRRTNVR